VNDKVEVLRAEFYVFLWPSTWITFLSVCQVALCPNYWCVVCATVCSALGNVIVPLRI